MTNPISDPVLDQFAMHAQAVFSLVAAGTLDRHTAMAGLVSDALAASCLPDLDPEVAEALEGMARTWAVTRAKGLAVDVTVADTSIPDDVATLLEEPGEGDGS